MSVTHTPTKAVAATVAALWKISRILVPLGIAALVTGLGVLVFFGLVAALP